MSLNALGHGHRINPSDIQLPSTRAVAVDATHALRQPGYALSDHSFAANLEAGLPPAADFEPPPAGVPLPD
jgi:hypothetical protein